MILFELLYFKGLGVDGLSKIGTLIALIAPRYTSTLSIIYPYIIPMD